MKTPHPPVFVVGTGRCGSTLLSKVLSGDPELLVVSELFVGLEPEPFPPGEMTGEEFWSLLATPQEATTLLVRHRLEPDEFLYRFQVGARFRRETGIAPIAAVSLPNLSADPDSLFAEVSAVVPTFETALIEGHYGRLFDWLCGRLGKRRWIERSGGSLKYVRQMIDLFPDARFVHIYRDGPSTAISMSKHSAYRLAMVGSMIEREVGFNPYLFAGPRPDVPSGWQPLMPESFDPSCFERVAVPVERYGVLWSAILARGLPVLRKLGPHKVVHVSYDGFVRDPAGELSRIASFLGEPSSLGGWLAEAERSVRRPSSAERGSGGPQPDRLLDACRLGTRLLAHMT